MSETDNERERDLDVAKMQLREAMDALDDGDLLEVLDAMGSVTTWIAKASQENEPVATVQIEPVGNADIRTADVFAGEAEEFEIHGKARVRVEGVDVGLHAEVLD